MTDPEQLAKDVFQEMFAGDAFSQWMGIEALKILPGYALLQMKVRKEMLNGFGVLHGGITFSLADSALAFASNSHGRQSLSIEAAINYFHPVREGQQLTAEAKEIHLGHKTGVYEVLLSLESGRQIARFKGTVYRSERSFAAADGGAG